jgi:hypothetical protein
MELHLGEDAVEVLWASMSAALKHPRTQGLKDSRMVRCEVRRETFVLLWLSSA